MGQVTFDDIAIGSPRDIVPINIRLQLLATEINGRLDQTNLANNSVRRAAIMDGEVIEGKLGDGSVTATKIGTGAVETEKIADDAVTAEKLASDAVVTASIVDNAVTVDKISDTGWQTMSIVAESGWSVVLSQYRDVGPLRFVKATFQRTGSTLTPSANGDFTTSPPPIAYSGDSGLPATCSLQSGLYGQLAVFRNENGYIRLDAISKGSTVVNGEYLSIECAVPRS